MNTYEKQREALEKADAALARISKSAWFMDANFGETVGVVEAGKAIRQALASPPRNCDVGTAEEQECRFHDFCGEHASNGCGNCPAMKGAALCVVNWGQMPYEEGGVK